MLVRDETDDVIAGVVTFNAREIHNATCACLVALFFFVDEV